jgi:hypothetical protein
MIEKIEFRYLVGFIVTGITRLTFAVARGDNIVMRSEDASHSSHKNCSNRFTMILNDCIVQIEKALHPSADTILEFRA